MTAELRGSKDRLPTKMGEIDRDHTTDFGEHVAIHLMDFKQRDYQICISWLVTVATGWVDIQMLSTLTGILRGAERVLSLPTGGSDFSYGENKTW